MLAHEELHIIGLSDKSRPQSHIALHPPFDSLSHDPEFQGKTGYSLSFAIAAKEQRRGLMREALETLIPELFQHQGADFLDCEAEPSNTACLSLQQKLGFTLWRRERWYGTELVIQVLMKEQ